MEGAPPQASQEKENLDVLRFQYMKAVDLYSHEDRLNWTKAAAVFVLSSLLATAFGAFVELPVPWSSAIMYVYFYAIVALGTLGLWLLNVSLKFGVHYMMKRKEAVIIIEQKLQPFGALPVVSATEESLRESPTTWVLRRIAWLPLALLALAFLIHVVRHLPHLFNLLR
jgi:hypothetical protein